MWLVYPKLQIIIKLAIDERTISMSELYPKSYQRILDAALTLFKEKGYKSVSIIEICRASECSVSTFYYQFKSKGELMLKLSSKNTALNSARIAKVLALSSPWEQLWTIHESFMMTLEHLGYELSTQVLMELLTTDLLYSQIPDMVYTTELVVPIIRRGQESGEVRNLTDPTKLVQAVWLMINGAFFTWAADNGSYSLRNALREVLEILYDIRPDLREFTAN